jgi:hypothetical protein
MIDRIYIAASGRDARHTRICVASIRYFYPDIPIRLLVGGPLQRGLAEELHDYWGVGTAALTSGDYGWGFVKLEALFGPPGETFLVLDSDTVLTGPVLDAWAEKHPPFLVDDEAQSEANTKRLYYDWEIVRKINPSTTRPQFVFNSGQWFGTAGILTRDDFAPWVEWTMPRRLRYPDCFMPGDQGVLNYVFNQKAALDGLHIERRQIMRWPGRSMQGLEAETVARRVAPPLVVHWAGVKRARQQDMIGADLLGYFEKLYYQRRRAGNVRRLLAGCRDSLSHWILGTRVNISLGSGKLLGKHQSNGKARH